MKRIFVCVALIFASPAFAQGIKCAPRDKVVARLAEKFGETRLGAGLSAGGVVELWASKAGGWTLLLSLPDGRSCLMSGGEAWQVLDPETPKPKGDPA